MEHKYNFHSEWENGTKKDHRLEVDIDLTLSNIFHGKDIVTELVTNESAVRREITEIVVHQLIPHMIENSGLIGHAPEGKTHYKSHSDTHSQWKIDEPPKDQGSLSIRSKMQILLEIKSDRAVNAMQALNGNPGALASAITDDIIFSLKQKYLGIKKHKTSSQMRTSDGKVMHYDAQMQTDHQAN